MSKYALDEKDFRILEELNRQPSSFYGLLKGLVLPSGTLASRLEKLVKWRYVEERDGRYALSEAGRIALKMGFKRFKEELDKPKWTVIPSDKASDEVRRLAELEVKVGPRKRLICGVFVDDEPIEEEVEMKLVACSFPLIHDAIFHRPLLEGGFLHNLVHEAYAIRFERSRRGKLEVNGSTTQGSTGDERFVWHF